MAAGAGVGAPEGGGAAAARPSVEERLRAADLTPMMRQYLTVKAAHPGALVLFRMGDFYETFYEDAEEAARLLDLTLTARSRERDIPMAGVPHHAVDGYLARLVELGRTVVIVDQVEDPRLARGLVRREVTRVLSPGTYLDPAQPPRAPSYLAALAVPGPGRRRKAAPGWALAALDLSTGEFRATSGDDDDLLLDEVGRLGPREVLLPEGLADDPRVVRLSRELPRLTLTARGGEGGSEGAARAALVGLLGEEEVLGLATVLPEHALVAAGMALRYAEEAELRPGAPDRVGPASLRHVEPLRPYVPGDHLVLDPAARDHLELFRAQGDGGRRGSLIGAIDEAATAMGGRLLARWLAYPLRDVPQIRARQDAVAALIAAPSALDRLRDALAGAGDLERLLGRISMGRTTPRDLGALAATLERAPALLAEAAVAGAPRGEAFEEALDPRPPTVSSARLVELAAVDPCADVLARLRAALVDDPPADLEAGPVFRPGHDPELDRLLDVGRNGKAHLAALEAREKEATGIPSLKVRFNKVFGYYLEVTRANLRLVPARYVRKQTTVGAERFFTEELKALETEILSAEERLVARTRELFAALVGEVAAEVGRLRVLGRSFAELDVLAGFARLAERRQWVRPVVEESGGIEILDGRHPVIEQLADALGERFVPNDVVIADDQRLVIITGPNMAGKSTVMRQTALIAILAHMGAFVPARSARLGLVDRVFTRVGASDDLSRGRSTFMVEMSETARILRSATSRSLILLDEIGRGTSTFDGLSIAWAVAEHLHDAIGAKTLFATHYHELTEFTRDRPRAVNRHVAVREYNDQIVFLRKLLPGPTNRSYGVQVARLAGLPRPVVERARQVLDALEAQALSAGDASAVAHQVRARASRDEGRGQLHLFAAPVSAAPEPPRPPRDPREDAVLDELRALSVDDLTPRQALERLGALQERLGARPASPPLEPAGPR